MSASNGKQRKNSGEVPESLKPHAFPAGHSGNPKGRPKGSVDIWARVRAKLREKVREGPHEGRAYADLVADSIVKAVLQGKWPQTKELLDREHGKPVDTVAHEGAVQIQVVYVPTPMNGRVSDHAARN